MEFSYAGVAPLHCMRGFPRYRRRRQRLVEHGLLSSSGGEDAREK